MIVIKHPGSSRGQPPEAVLKLEPGAASAGGLQPPAGARGGCLPNAFGRPQTGLRSAAVERREASVPSQRTQRRLAGSGVSTCLAKARPGVSGGTLRLSALRYSSLAQNQGRGGEKIKHFGAAGAAKQT